MMDFLKRITNNLRTLITAVALAIAVWVLAVTNTDPVERRNFDRPVPIEISSQDPSLVITNDPPDQVSVVLSAPVSTWNSELNSSSAVRAVVDLSGLKAGVYEVPVNLQISVQPVKVETYTPDTITIQLEQLYTESFTINLVQPSSPAIGYEAGEPELDVLTATVSGPSSLVDQVEEVCAVLDISQAQEDIDRDIPLVALDENGLRVSGVTINPEEVNVTQKITQRGGYRNVTVKVVTTGQIASGYRLTNISNNPLVVTVFSTDPKLVINLPGFIETQPLNLTGAEEDLQVSLPLAVPAGIIVVGESTITVNVSISPLQGSITLTSLPIEIIGLMPEFDASISPDRVDVILSGPLPKLDGRLSSDVRVLLDLTEVLPGTYQISPGVEVGPQGILVESILPATIEVEIKPVPTATPSSP